MRFELSADVFTDDGFEHIAFLIRYFSEGRHEWIVGMPQLSAIEDYFREQVPKRAEVWIALARKATVSEVWTAGPARPDGMTITRKSLADDVHDLGLAARVVLENGDGDGDFVLAIAYVLGAERITKAKERHWLKFVHGGGSGEVPKVVRREHEEFRRTIRVTFLLDSDRMTPEERSKHEAAVEELRDVGIHGHVLRYREIENYVPNRVLAAATVPRPREVPLTERIDSLKTLTCDQRAHFDMKKGFADRKKEGFAVPAQQEDLYGSLPARTLTRLRLGFGDDLTRILLQEAKAGKLKESDFDVLGPEVCDELRTILDVLQRIL